MIRKIKIALSILLAAVMLTACGNSLPENVVAKVNGVEITKDYYEKTIAKVGEDNGFRMLYGDDVWDMEIEEGVTFREMFSQQMLDIIIMQELVYQDAEGKGLLATEEEIEKEFTAYMEIVNKDAEYSEFLKTNNIDEAFIKEHLAKSLTYNKYASAMMEQIEVTDEEAQTYYDEHIADFTNNQVRASHILISTTDENGQPLSDELKAEKLALAEELLQRARNNEDFATLAKDYSDDTYSAVNGGDLDYFSEGMMVPAFNDMAFSMEVGEISDIVETEFGYHIIYLTDKINEVTSFEDAKQQIIEQLRFEKFQAQLDELNANGKVIINETLENN